MRISWNTVKSKICELILFCNIYTAIRLLRNGFTVPVDHIKVQTNTTADMVGNGVTNARSLDEEIDRLYSVLWKRENNIIKMLHHMHNVDYMKVLFKVYVQGKIIKQAS